MDSEAQGAVGAETASRRGIDWDQQREALERLADRPWRRWADAPNLMDL
jgi:hypothetical protein